MPTSSTDADDAGPYLAVARRLGDRLCRQAIWHEDRCTWLGDASAQFGEDWIVVHQSVDRDLYSGTAGIALFLQRLWEQADEERYLATARGALSHSLHGAWEQIPRRGEDLTLHASFYSGLLGPAWVAVEFGRGTDDEKLVDDGTNLASELLGRAAEAPRLEWDLLGGAAGMVAAAVDLGMLELGEALSQRIVDAARSQLVGCGWGSAYGDQTGQAPWCGLAHGGAGISLALVEIGTQLGDEGLLRVAEDALAYERSWFDRERENWPDLRELTPDALRHGAAASFPSFWCHGSVGIGLARLRSYELTSAPVQLAEAGVALETSANAAAEAMTTYEYGYGCNFSQCHGLAGMIELFVAAYRLMGEHAHLQLAEAIGDYGIVHCADAELGWPCGVRDGGETPGLMLGIAGIGAAYLALHDPINSDPVALPCSRSRPPISYSDHMPKRVVVKFDRTIDAAEAAGAVVAGIEGARVVRVSPRGRAVIELADRDDAPSVASAISRQPGVIYAEPDAVERGAKPSSP